MGKMSELLSTLLLLFFQQVHSSLQPSLSCLPHCRCTGQEIDCTGAGYAGFPLQPAKGKSLVLAVNNLTLIELNNVQHWPGLRSLDLSRNRIKTVEGTQQPLQLEQLDLSSNQLQVLHSFVFSQLPQLHHLNLSNNNLHTVSHQTFYLPSLTVLDLSHNDLPDLPDDPQRGFPRLQKLFFKDNRISRIMDGSISLLESISILDFSSNALMDMEDNSLTSLNISYLDLSFNTFRKVPTPALRNLKEVTTLILDGNQFESLQSGAIKDIPVKFLSVSRCPLLRTVHENSITRMPMLETLTLNSNPSLVYYHPGAVSFVGNLMVLDLTRNKLFALEDIQPYVPSLRNLFLEGNRFKCHCGLKWLQENIQNGDSGFKVKDGDKVTCGETELATVRLAKEPLTSFCKPYILPLYPAAVEVNVGSNASWTCKAIDSTRSRLEWYLVDGVHLREGECNERRCVLNSTLYISYAHQEDRGNYTCKVMNTHGQDERTVHLSVKMLHVQIFPLTVADTFVTLSWNTSRSLAKDFLIRVQSEYESSSLMEYDNIEVGHKMSSYTISNLKPSRSYKISLCLKKGAYTIQVSSTFVKTRPENYMESLGIVTDYTSIAVVSLVFVMLGGSCIILSVFRLYKLRYLVEGDTMSTKLMMSPVSEPTSGSGIPPITEKEKSRLVDNEILSPTEDVRTLESNT